MKPEFICRGCAHARSDPQDKIPDYRTAPFHILAAREYCPKCGLPPTSMKRSEAYIIDGKLMLNDGIVFFFCKCCGWNHYIDGVNEYLKTMGPTNANVEPSAGPNTPEAKA